MSEKKEEVLCVEEATVEGVLKDMENRRKFLKKVMKPAEEAKEDLEKATATEKVRLQGTKEPEVPNLKPYTESLDVQSRQDLGKLIEWAKKEHRVWKIKRCTEEKEKAGFRYTFFTDKLDEDVRDLVDNKKIVLDEDTELVPAEISIDDFMPVEEEPVEAEVVEPEETPVPEEEEEIDLNAAIELLKSKLEFHPSEEGNFDICFKDGEEESCIEVKGFDEDELELLGKVFFKEEEAPVEKEHEEEIEEAFEDRPLRPELEPEEYGKEVTEKVKALLNAGFDINSKVEYTKGSDQWKTEIEVLNILEDGSKIIGKIKPEAKQFFADSFNEKLIDHAGEKKEESLTEDDKLVEVEAPQNCPSEETIGKVLIHLCKIGEGEETVMRCCEYHGVNWEEFDPEYCRACGIELDESSSAEKKAFGGDKEAATDLIMGRALARVKDPHERAMLIHQHRMEKNGKKMSDRPDVETTIKRKVDQADAAFDKKASKMAAAVKEEMPVDVPVEPETLEEGVKISLDDLSKFQPWGGAKDIWTLIIDQNKVEELDKALEDMYPEGITTTELNDILWFEKDWIISTLDIVPFIPSEDAIEAEVVELPGDEEVVIEKPASEEEK